MVDLWARREPLFSASPLVRLKPDTTSDFLTF